MAETKLQCIDPRPTLRSVIDSYWLIDQRDIPERVSPMVPLGYPLIEINLEPGWLTRSVQAGGQAFQHLAIGLSDQPLYFSNPPRTRSLLVRLKPWGLAAMTDQAYTANYFFSADQIFKDSIFRLSEALSTQKSPAALKAGLDDFFLQHLSRRTTAVDERLIAAVRLIVRHRGLLPIAELARAVCLSQRRLEQLFKASLGMSPKAYASVVQFQYGLQCQTEYRRLTDLALAAGYYDQAHFIRSFRKFTGSTPSSLLSDRNDAGPDLSNLYNSVF